jgi:hypothetical protein
VGSKGGIASKCKPLSAASSPLRVSVAISLVPFLVAVTDAGDHCTMNRVKVGGENFGGTFSTITA